MSSSERDGRYPGPPEVSTDGAEIVRSAGVVGGATLASRVLGLVRDVVVANLFPAAATDAFFVAFMLPNLLRRLVGEGSLTISFVPVFSSWLSRSREAARDVFSTIWTLAFAVGVAIALAGILAADPLVGVFAPGFELTEGKRELTATLTRLCFPYILAMILLSVAMGALNSLGHFLVPALAPVLLNLCLIAAAFVSVALLDQPIEGLAVAVLLAGILQVLVLLPPLRARAMAPRVLWAIRHPAVRRLGQLMLPAMLGASVFQLNLLLSRFLASFLGDGAVSYLYYASRLLELPLGVFVFALGAASLPSFSRLISTGDREGLRRTFSTTLGTLLALALPASAGLVLLSEPIFAVLFGLDSSVFGRPAIEASSTALFFYAFGLVPIALTRIYANLCFAHENTATAARGALVSLLVNALASLCLIGPLPGGQLPSWLLAAQHSAVVADLGFVGLALASTIAATANCAYVIASARRRYGSQLESGSLLGWGKILVAAGAMVALLRGLDASLPVGPEASLAALAVLALHVAMGLLGYGLALQLLRSNELQLLRNLFRGRDLSVGR